MPHACLVVTWRELVFNLDSIRKFHLANMDKHNQSYCACSPVPKDFIAPIWLCCVCGGAHTHTHTHTRVQTHWHAMLTRHEEACWSRSFEVCLSWSSYVSPDTDPSLHANPFVIEPLRWLSAPRSSTLLRPGVDRPGLAPIQGQHAKYGWDTVNKTVVFFLTTVQQQLEKCWDQNDFLLGLL